MSEKQREYKSLFMYVWSELNTIIISLWSLINIITASRVVGDDDDAAAAVENDAHVKSSRKNGRRSGKQIVKKRRAKSF